MTDVELQRKGLTKRQVVWLKHRLNTGFELHVQSADRRQLQAVMKDGKSHLGDGVWWMSVNWVTVPHNTSGFAVVAQRAVKEKKATHANRRASRTKATASKLR
jgi:hypothetical protein